MTDICLKNLFNTENAVKMPIFGVEILYDTQKNYPTVLKQVWGKEIIKDKIEWFKTATKKAQEVDASFVSIYLNIQDKNEIENCAKFIEDIQKIAQLPLMVRFAQAQNLDVELAKKIIPILEKNTILAPINSNNYEEIIKTINTANKEHICVLRTPIDINLTKELNILSTDSGLKKENIIIDPDTGCVGYGLDYGYSIIERICLAKPTDEMLDMPIIVFCGEETFKAKEARSEQENYVWGDVKNRALLWEITTATALINAGADCAVVWNPDTVRAIKKQYCEGL